MKYLISPILDVDSTLFINNREIIFQCAYKYLDIIMTPQIETDSKTYLANQRYIRALELLNTAYELASVCKFDETQILLTTLLESLFLKNEGVGKQNRISKHISEYIDENCGMLVEKTYKKRNLFVHEGKSIGRISRYELAEHKHNYFMGKRPFTEYSFWGYPEAIKDLKKLMLLCIDILFKMNSNNNFFVGDYENRDNQ